MTVAMAALVAGCDDVPFSTSGAHILGGGARIGGRYGFSSGIYDAGDSALIENVTIFGFGTVDAAIFGPLAVR